MIELRYGLKGEGPWTCEEIGRHFGVTPQKIQMLDNQAHRKLMEACESDEDLIDLIAQWNSVFPEKKGAALVLPERAVAFALGGAARRGDARPATARRDAPQSL